MRVIAREATQRVRRILFLALIVVPLLAAADTHVEPDAAARDAEAAKGEAEVESEMEEAAGKQGSSMRIVYVPPIRGSVKVSVGGGIRFGGRAMPEVVALAPEHVAQTARAHPTLFWHLDSELTDGTRIEFVLLREDAVDPVVQRAFPAPRPGVQRLELADLGVELESGVDYEWSIALVRDEDDRSADTVSLAGLRRVDASATKSLLGLDPQDPASLAMNSLWYDALARLQDAVEAAPDDPAPRARRDALLRQAGLSVD